MFCVRQDFKCFVLVYMMLYVNGKIFKIVSMKSHHRFLYMPICTRAHMKSKYGYTALVLKINKRRPMTVPQLYVQGGWILINRISRPW